MNHDPIIYDLKIFETFFDILIKNNNELNIRYEMNNNCLNVCYNNIELLSVTNYISNAEPVYSRWIIRYALDQHDYSSMSISYAVDNIYTIINGRTDTINWDAAFLFIANFITKETQLFSWKLTSLGILHRLTHFRHAYHNFMKTKITFPSIFLPIDGQPETSELYFCRGRASMFFKSHDLIITINNNQCLLTYFKTNDNFDLTKIAHNRRNQIINQKLLLFLQIKFGLEMNNDISILIMKLCFDLCYLDWNSEF